MRNKSYFAEEPKSELNSKDSFKGVYIKETVEPQNLVENVDPEDKEINDIWQAFNETREIIIWFDFN